MTTNRQFGDSEGDFAAWQDHPEPCQRIMGVDQIGTNPSTPVKCGAKVRYRSWESSDGAYEDYQYRCENGHLWWIDGIDA